MKKIMRPFKSAFISDVSAQAAVTGFMVNIMGMILFWIFKTTVSQPIYIIPGFVLAWGIFMLIYFKQIPRLLNVLWYILVTAFLTYLHILL